MLCLAIENFRTYAQSASAFRERWPVDTHCPGELARCYARMLRTTRRTGGTWTNTGANGVASFEGIVIGVGFGVGVGVGVCVGVAVGVGVGVGVGCTMESMESMEC